MKRVFISHSRHDYTLYSYIVNAIQNEGLYVIHADSLEVTSDIKTEIFSAIRQSDFVIAIINDEVPSSNVMFELGYALGVSKKVFLVSEKSTKLPFELASLPVISVDLYDNSGLNKLIDSIKAEPDLSETETFLNLPPKDVLSKLSENPSLIDQIQPRQFEELIAEYLIVSGFSVEKLSPKNNFGYDFLIKNIGDIENIIVEVKKYNQNSKVSVSEIQRILGVAVLEKADGALIITTGEFTNSALYFAQNAPIIILPLTIKQLLDESKDSITKRFT
jgi:hypothetical protein